MLQGSQRRRVGGMLQRSRVGKSDAISQRPRTVGVPRQIASSPHLANVDQQLATEFDRRITQFSEGPLSIVVVTDDRCLIVRVNQRAEQMLGAMSSKIVGMNVCDAIGSRLNRHSPSGVAVTPQLPGVPSLSCASVTPFESRNKNWLLWELTEAVPQASAPEPASVSVEIDDKQLRFDSGGPLIKRRSPAQPNVTKIDRSQAVLALEADEYRNAVKRMTSLIGQLDLLGLLTARLERRISAATELQPILQRAVCESKEISESLLTMHTLHQGYTAKLQWCDLAETLGRCIEAVTREMAGCDIQLKRLEDSRKHLLHVDKIALSRAIFWMIHTASRNLSKSDRGMTLRSDFMGDELCLKIVYRPEEIGPDATTPAFGVLQFDDKIDSQSDTENLHDHASLSARWAAHNRPDGLFQFDLFVRCPYKEL